MRYLIYFVIFAILSIATALLAHLYLNDPVTLRYGAWEATPPLSLILGVLVIAVLALLLGMRLFLLILFFPAKLATWRRQRLAEKQATIKDNILRWSAYGNRRNLLKNLDKLAPTDASALWQAVQVAEELGDERAKSKYLQQAVNSKDSIICAAAKAKLCLQDKHLIEADAILKAAGAPQGAVLLAELYFQMSIMRTDYVNALKAAMHLREELPLSWQGRVEEVISKYLEQSQTAEKSSAFWNEQVAAAEKKSPLLLAAYAKSLWRLGNEKHAGEVLSQALKQHPQNNFILRAAVEFGTQQQCELAFQGNEKRVETADVSDIEFLQILTLLAEKLNLTGKARLYGQRISALQLQRHSA